MKNIFSCMKIIAAQQQTTDKPNIFLSWSMWRSKVTMKCCDLMKNAELEQREGIKGKVVGLDQLTIRLCFAHQQPLVQEISILQTHGFLRLCMIPVDVKINQAVNEYQYTACLIHWRHGCIQFQWNNSFRKV